jgi:N-methylhydantoinase A
VLSACGALYSDVISEFSQSRYTETRALDRDAVNAAIAEAEEAADRFLGSLADLAPRELRKDFLVEARYRAQVWELDVPIPSRLRSDEDVALVEEAFHEMHERVFAVREPGQYLECLLWKVRATAVLEKPQVRTRAVSDTGEAAPVSYTDAYFDGTGLVSVPRYEGDALPVAARIEGPAIIREPTTTVVVYPDSVATVTALGNYLLDVTAEAAESEGALEEKAGAL